MFGLVQDYLSSSLFNLVYMLKVNLTRLDAKNLKVRIYSQHGFGI
jgi:hypothetical protein